MPLLTMIRYLFTINLISFVIKNVYKWKNKKLPTLKKNIIFYIHP